MILSLSLFYVVNNVIPSAESTIILSNSELWVVRFCEMFLLFFPRFHRPSQEQAGNGVGSKLHQPTFHLLTVFPYPCGTEAVSDFQAMRKEAAKHKQAIYLKSNDLLGYNHIR